MHQYFTLIFGSSFIQYIYNFFLLMGEMCHSLINVDVSFTGFCKKKKETKVRYNDQLVIFAYHNELITNGHKYKN
jgi:hypothetical protein